MLPDLGTAAARETAAIATARQLRTAARDLDDGRPVLTRFRRPGNASRTWAVRLVFADQHGCVRWSTVVGLRDAYSVVHPADMRLALDAAFIEDAVREAWPTRRGQLLDGAERSTLTALAREDEILESIHAAREQMTPVSRGLFDRRQEHTASVQTEILADAARQCERRRRHLASLLPLTLSASELTFAVVSE